MSHTVEKQTGLNGSVSLAKELGVLYANGR